MKLLNWDHIKEILSDKSTLGLKLLFIFLLAYIISTGTDHKMLKLPLLCIGLFLTVFFVKKINQPLLWYAFLVILISDLICDYFVRANHHFLLIYMTILIIVFLHNNRLEDLVINFKLVVVIVLFFSGIQKLFSAQFISGDFYYYMINTGSFFKPILHFDHDMLEVVSGNKTLILELGQTDPNALKSITLRNVVPNLGVISRVFAWLTIILELTVAVLVLLKPKKVGTHLLFILLILGIFFTRLENGFLALLAISGIWLSENIRIRAVYSILVLIFLVFIVTKIGFY
ncbi:MAG: hypothetical protein R2783_06450 [Gelidibacter sp.]